MSQQRSKSQTPREALQNPTFRGLLRFLGKFLPGAMRENLQQWLIRGVHEEDFLLFDQMADVPGLVLDIGANRGHAAISVLRRTRRMRVLSLEPNPELSSGLLVLRLLHPWRFRYRLVAAGAHAGTAELLIPLSEIDLSTQASLDPAEFDKGYVQERLASHGHDSVFRKLEVKLCRVDDLGLAPDVVKIDVEGWEAQVIEGMQKTLVAHKPMLIIEINNSPRWAPGLEELGYRFFTLEDGKLVNHEDWRVVPGLNMICCHPGSTSAITRHFRPPSDWQ